MYVFKYGELVHVRVCVTSVYICLARDACVITHTKAPFGGGGIRGMVVRLATKGQCKLFSSSHSNRGKADKGLPRKAML